MSGHLSGQAQLYSYRWLVSGHLSGQAVQLSGR